MGADIFDDLVAEQERLEAILARLPAAAWDRPSAVDGWSVRDVVLHLAQTEEAVMATVAGQPGAGLMTGRLAAERPAAGTIDEVMDRMVRADSSGPGEVFARWAAARRAAVAALRGADPRKPLAWAQAPLKPATLATTRLAEHWAHGLDITGPLGVAFPDTGRLRHIAWLGHSTLPYAFALAGLAPQEIYCELAAPDGATWCYGPPEAGSTVTGPAGDFCRVGARRLRPERSGLAAGGPHAGTALRVLRNYAA
ncbi:MAG TPA: maleylpyruvate isomerase family mycothiol-dependent enzyme [Micromonosporaceae bacterium]|nr:maleylpyruvate isomerase family mycothiol-dependent enzyme [Micromonosporaceae bacterium]